MAVALICGANLAPLTGRMEASETAFRLSYSRGIAAFNSEKWQEAIADFEDALEERPDDAGARYCLALALNRGGEPEKAIPLLEALIASNTAFRKEATLELGIARYLTGRYDSALEALSEASRGEAGFAEARYYTALALLELGRHREADEAIAGVRSSLDPRELALYHYRAGLAYLEANDAGAAERELRRAAALLPAGSELRLRASSLAASLKAPTYKRRLLLEALGRYEYDSNVATLPYDTDIFGVSGKDDFRFMTNVTADYLLPLEKGFSLDSRYTFTQSVHHRLGYYNLQGHELAETVAVGLTPLTPFIGYGYDYWLLDDAHQSFLRSHSIFSGVSLAGGDSGLTRIFYRFRTDDYMVPFSLDEDDRDAGNHSISIERYFFLGRDRSLLLRSGLEYERNNAEGANFSYDGYRLSAALTLPFGRSMYFDAQADYYIRNFFENIGSRYDDRQSYVFTLTRRLNDYFDLSLQYNLIVNDSTLAAFEYDRGIYSIVGRIWH